MISREYSAKAVHLLIQRLLSDPDCLIEEMIQPLMDIFCRPSLMESSLVEAQDEKESHFKQLVGIENLVRHGSLLILKEISVFYPKSMSNWSEVLELFLMEMTEFAETLWSGDEISITNECLDIMNSIVSHTLLVRDSSSDCLTLR